MAPWQVIRVDLDKLRDQAPTLVSSIQEIMKKLEELQQAIFGDLVMPEGVMMYISTIYIYIHTIYICIYCIYIIYYIISYIVYIYIYLYFVHHPLCFSKWMCFVGFLDLMGIRSDSNLWIHAKPNDNWGYVFSKRKRGAIVAVWQRCRVNHCHLSWLVFISHQGQLPIGLRTS